MATLSLGEIDASIRGSERALNAGALPGPVRRARQACAYWLKYAVTPGAGLFAEFYLLIVYNQVSGPFSQNLPWTTCYGPERDTITKMGSLAGLPIGMLVFGALADKLGRRVGSLLTLSCTLLGAVFLSAASPAPFPDGDFGACNQFFWWIFGAYLLFGFGVGGEYPLSASISSEQSASKAASAELDGAEVPPIRGRDVLLTFTMRGLGSNAGNLVFFALTASAGQAAAEPATVTRNYRLTMGIAVALLLGVLPFRVLAHESEQWQAQKRRKEEAGVPTPGTAVIVRFYWLRLVGTCGSWFLWDVIQYGNSLFSKQITASFDGGLTPVQVSGYAWLYEAVALVGYFAAAFTVDRMGRRRMQLMGFAVVAALFFVFGGVVPTLQRQNLSAVFVFLYCLSKFFSAFGADSTTFLIPSEAFATPVRARCHGLSAFSGKVGALVGTFGVGTLNDMAGLPAVFFFLGAAALGGAALTFFLVPESRDIDAAAEDERFVLAWLGDGEAAARYRDYEKNKTSVRDLEHAEGPAAGVELGPT